MRLGWKCQIDSSDKKGWIRIMNKIVLHLLLSSVLLGGCTISPAVNPVIRSLKLEDKEACLGFQENRPHFAIVTDGSIHGRVTVLAHISVTYGGRIANHDNSENVSFRVEGKNIEIGEQRYDLREGHLFLVAVTSEPFRITQFKVSEADKIRALIGSDSRMKSFFEK